MNQDYRILIVDDNPINLDIIEEFIDDRCVTCQAESGEEALSKLDDFKPNLILLDVMMPGIDGYETCTEIRASQNYSNVKVIMISAKAEKDDIKKGFEAGADDYVTKPFEEDTLLEVINQYTQ